jgi:hypothetical protein
MVGTIPFELIGLVCTVACIVGLSVALVTYVQRSRQRKRGGEHPVFVTRASPDTPAEESVSQRVGERVQNVTVPAFESNPVSSETTQARLDQKPSVTALRQEMLHQPFPEPASPSSKTELPRLERPVVGVPGRTLDPLNLADEIDQMVQHRLRGRPDLADRHIRLASGLDGGLRIYVDDEVFEAVSDITDFRVRELIRDTIREWEGV